MTTDEAKAYLMEGGLPESDFFRASEEYAGDEDIEVGDWMVDTTTTTENGTEYDSEPAIEMAKDRKWWSDPKNVDSYIDFMMKDEFPPSP